MSSTGLFSKQEKLAEHDYCKLDFPFNPESEDIDDELIEGILLIWSQRCLFNSNYVHIFFSQLLKLFQLGICAVNFPSRFTRH